MVCAGCGQESAWEHSRYVRHVADEAIGGRPVVIDRSVRRLYCENPDCSRTTFREQVPGLTVRYQRPRSAAWTGRAPGSKEPGAGMAARAAAGKRSGTPRTGVLAPVPMVRSARPQPKRSARSRRPLRAHPSVRNFRTRP
ncbi:transposase family protein [Streptomyces sp900116325]|uniref:transposase family protein n=1 Tax=Streptomyces sp. 900116325 TaxID=3154295 RepID=UPI0033A664F0